MNAAPSPDQRRQNHFSMLNMHQHDAELAAAQTYEDRQKAYVKFIGNKWQIDRELYEEFEDMLPPLGWTPTSFYLREFLFDDITHKFTKEGDRYFCETVRYPRQGRPLPPGMGLQP